MTNTSWDDDSQSFTATQTEGILEACGIEVVSETSTHFLCLCPWHGNTDTPALEVDKVRGVYYCFNPSCGRGGTVEEMIKSLLKYNTFQTYRLIITQKKSDTIPFSKKFNESMIKPPEFEEFSSEVIERMASELKGSVAEEYMHSRGFTDETLEYFSIGYSERQNMVVVPMHDPDGMVIGLIGRTPSRDDKRFKNSFGLPKAKTAWNFHRAKKSGGTVIVVEASFDAMRVHQSGYPNVIALLGGSATPHHLEQINRHFSKVIVMTDFDKKKYKPNCRACKDIKFEYGKTPCVGHSPGRDLGRQLVNGLPGKKVMWAAYDDTCVYPHGAKDASDMTDDEIRQCLRNAVSNLEYSQWNIEDSLA